MKHLNIQYIKITYNIQTNILSTINSTQKMFINYKILAEFLYIFILNGCIF